MDDLKSEEEFKEKSVSEQNWIIYQKLIGIRIKE